MTADQNAIERIRQAFEAHRKALEALEEAILEGFDSQSRNGYELLSIPEVCQELGMGRSWVYQRLKSGEIPSIRLGHTIKVRRKDLQEYLEKRRYPHAQ